MYNIDLTHPDYFNQMKNLELTEKTKNVQKPIKLSRVRFIFNIAAFTVFYFVVLFGIMYYFST